MHAAVDKRTEVRNFADRTTPVYTWCSGYYPSVLRQTSWEGRHGWTTNNEGNHSDEESDEDCSSAANSICASPQTISSVRQKHGNGKGRNKAEADLPDEWYMGGLEAYWLHPDRGFFPRRGR
ncbi:hypothetical protein N7530_007854 [Penicillium desertorum]|uniref:Uncharacterized protein n=1 Tax=Penicillium desertorum TaxID=1303715 RepID=A0A9X0BKQ3_9EURO|nr:hypothetical protein N7530_007854 [Penicillium desertorum]